MSAEVKKPQPPDVMFKLKHIAYCRSQTPLSDMTLKDFVAYAKFQLCFKTKTLFKDPIWDNYTQEEILVEWFSHEFESNPQLVKEFEIGMSKGEVLDFNSWADLQMKKEQEERAKKIRDQEDKVSFSPDDVMGEQ